MSYPTIIVAAGPLFQLYVFARAQESCWQPSVVAYQVVKRQISTSPSASEPVPSACQMEAGLQEA